MTDDQYLSEKAIYLLDQSVEHVFQRYGLAREYGPADRYGVVEWAASVKDLTPFFRGMPVDLNGVSLDTAIAAWPPADPGEEYAAVIQVTLGARSHSYFTRWSFAPATLKNLQDLADSERLLALAVDQVYSSTRTLSAIQAVLSPENAPSDMRVLPVFVESASASAGPGSTQ